MSKQIRLIVRNSTPQNIRPQTERLSARSEELSSLPDFKNRLAQLNGNLKILERKYRNNLKEGFDNKIKAYRLQAVTERKLLQRAVEQSHRAEEEEELQQKFMRKEEMKVMEERRLGVIMWKQKEQFRLTRKRHQSQKQKMTLTMRERSKQEQNRIREQHDRIVAESLNKNKKRIYLQVMKKVGVHQSQLQLKEQLFGKLVRNTARLKHLREQLQVMRQEPADDTFLTL